MVAWETYSRNALFVGKLGSNEACLSVNWGCAPHQQYSLASPQPVSFQEVTQLLHAFIFRHILAGFFWNCRSFDCRYTAECVWSPWRYQNVWRAITAFNIWSWPRHEFNYRPSWILKGLCTLSKYSILTIDTAEKLIMHRNFLHAIFAVLRSALYFNGEGNTASKSHKLRCNMTLKRTKQINSMYLMSISKSFPAPNGA